MTTATESAKNHGFRRLMGASVALTLVLTIGPGGPAAAGQWTIEVEALQMEAYGHDQHVLTTHDLSFGVGTLLSDTQTAVSLDTNSGGAYRGTFLYSRGGKWSWGVDYLWFNTSQDAPDRTAAAAGGGDALSFEIAERFYFSSGPDQVLYHRVLEDTDLAIWTLDLHVRRIVAETADSAVALILGLRVGDFDNDYRAVTGIEGVAGTRQDASSNYGAMYGPIVGFDAEARRGKHRLHGYLSQSVLLGTADLFSRARDFLGPFSAEPAFLIDEAFAESLDVAIPISELRLGWGYQATRRLGLGLSAIAAAWWDVPVPPGVIPVFDGGQMLNENTIVFFGLGAVVRMTF